MMLHQDGSRHAWLSGLAPLDLVITLDDATSAIYSASLVAEEGTASTFAGLAETIAAHGLPCASTPTAAATTFTRPRRAARWRSGVPTQVGRALAHLGIEHIAAYSPQARGRCERVFQTLQDRLPKELALAGITTTWRRPTASSARPTCRRTTRGLRCSDGERLGLRAGGRGAVA